MKTIWLGLFLILIKFTLCRGRGSGEEGVTKVKESFTGRCSQIIQNIRFGRNFKRLSGDQNSHLQKGKKGPSKVEWTWSKFHNYLLPWAEQGPSNLSPSIVSCFLTLLLRILRPLHSWCRAENIEQRGTARRVALSWDFGVPPNSECGSAWRKHCLPS